MEIGPSGQNGRHVPSHVASETGRESGAAPIQRRPTVAWTAPGSAWLITTSRKKTAWKSMTARVSFAHRDFVTVN